jgi:DNA-binding CsgD family transcriptional regulator
VVTQNARMLVGRGLELAQVARRVKEQRPLLAVVGEAGVGKTTLVRAALEASGRPAHEGGAFATLSWMPYLPLVRAFGSETGQGDAAFAAGLAEQRVGPEGILFLDDLHWADRQTLAAVGLLRGRVGLVVALRPGTSGTAEAIAAVDGADVLELDGLADADALELLHNRAPKLQGEAARRVVRVAGGNPLLLEELATGDGVSESLRLSLEARLRAVTPDAIQAMSMLSLAGRPLERALLPGGGEDLIEAGLAVGTGQTISPRHGLLAETAAEMLSADERQRVHGALAEVLTEPGEQAVHLAAAGRREAAFAAARLAADRATTPGERVTHLELAARCAPSEGAVALRLEAAEALSQALMIRELAVFLDSVEPPDDQSRARVELHRSVVALDLGDTAEAERAVDRGLELVSGSGSTTEGLLLSRKGILEKLLHNRPERSVELARAGAGLADTLDRPRALSTLAWMLSESAAPQQDWVSTFREAIDAARAVEKPSVELMAWNNLCGCMIGSLTPLQARPHVESALQRARELRFLDWERMLRVHEISLDLIEGLFDGAIDQCEALLADSLQEQLRGIVLESQAEAFLATGRFAEASRVLDALERLSAVRPYTLGRGRMARADLELWSGRPQAAIAIVDEFLGEDRPELAYLRLETSLVRAWALLELGRAEPELAESELTELDELRRDELRAIQLLDKDPSQAAAAFERQAEAWRGVSRRDELRCRWAAGEAARRAGEPAAALEHLQDAEQGAETYGMMPLLARIHRSLRLLGERRAAPRAAESGLTAREREILELVGSGLTNPEIARRLGTSVPTVARQIATASQKLGAKTRAQAATLAVQP